MNRVALDNLGGGINRAVEQSQLQPNELYNAVGVFQKNRKALNSCYEEATNSVTFTDAANTLSGKKKVPLRTIYWPDDGKVWQLYSKDAAGATSIRRESTDREYDNFEATAAVYKGYLLMGGTGEQATATHANYSCERSNVLSAFTYTSATGVVSATTFSAGTINDVLTGDIWETPTGARYAITDHRHGYSGTAFTYDNGTGVVSAITFSAGFNINWVRAGDSVTLNGTTTPVISVTPSGPSFTVAAGLGAIATGNFSAPSQFTVASGLGTIASGTAYVERWRPIHLGATYQGTEKVACTSSTKTAGSKNLTLSAVTALSAGVKVRFCSGTYWDQSTADTRDYEVLNVSGSGPYTVTLTDTYEGTTVTNSNLCYRAVLTPLYTSQPFIYKDRLFWVGANSTTEDYNTLYLSGWPGSTSTDSDIFDFTYCDQTSTSYPLGVNAGAIQRPIATEDRVYVFCQNGVFEVRGTPPVDAAQGSDLQDRQLADGLGANAYDAVVAGPDRQTVYFACQGGIFSIANGMIQPIDSQIKEHELYTTLIDYAAYYDNRLYFTDATDDASRVSSTSPQRNQYAPIWIFDLLTNTWSVDQRLYGHGNYTGTITSDYQVKPLYAPGYHGGIMNPKRGDYTATEYLYIGTPGGLVQYNPANVDSTEITSYIQHAAYVATAGLGPKDGVRKRVRRFGAQMGLSGASTLGFVTPSDAKRTQSGLIVTGVSTAEGKQFNCYGLGNGRGGSWLSFGVGYGQDVGATYTGTVSGTANVTSATVYLVWPLAVPLGQNYRLMFKGKCTGLTNAMTVVAYALDANRAELTSATVDVSTWTVSSTSHWYSALFSGGTGTSTYVALTVTGASNTFALDYAAATGINLSTMATLGGALSTSVSDVRPLCAYQKVVGSVTAIDQLENLWIDYVPLGGMKV